MKDSGRKLVIGDPITIITFSSGISSVEVIRDFLSPEYTDSFGESGIRGGFPDRRRILPRGIKVSDL